jgi:hypothetical protein
MKKKEKTSKWGARAARSLRATARPIDFAVGYLLLFFYQWMKTDQDP